MDLHTLQNTTRNWKRRKRVGRGIGSGRGKTCCRGIKGAGARSGWKRRDRFEGGQIPLYRKLPQRGFSNEFFTKRYATINFYQIERVFEDGETVNADTLLERGLLKKGFVGIKLLSTGDLTKRVQFEVHAISKQAEAKLQAAGIGFTLVGKSDA